MDGKYTGFACAYMLPFNLPTQINKQPDWPRPELKWVKALKPPTGFYVEAFPPSLCSPCEAAGLSQLFPVSRYQTRNKTLWVLILSSLYTPAWNDRRGEPLSLIGGCGRGRVRDLGKDGQPSPLPVLFQSPLKYLKTEMWIVHSACEVAFPPQSDCQNSDTFWRVPIRLGC